MLPDSKEIKLKSSNQGASPRKNKNARIVLVPCYAWNCVPMAIFGGVGIPVGPGCQLLW